MTTNDPTNGEDSPSRVERSRAVLVVQLHHSKHRVSRLLRSKTKARHRWHLVRSKGAAS
jgi:hypothetical protein